MMGILISCQSRKAQRVIANLAFLNQRIQSANASTIARGHAVNLVHNQACSVCYGNTQRVRLLFIRQVRRLAKTETTHLTTADIAIERGIVDVHAILGIDKHARTRGYSDSYTSTSFLLRASLAFNSMGVYPASLAHRCALVVLPIPGGPVMRTARLVFIAFLPGFLKSAL